ncbi:hypothetical protein [Pseudoalteromonas tunicata]|uniref:Orphan protein n=1 Tax=Pseudoalteromonas tunicata D2 TaxID=87626 RepID=A4CDM4_9GAMM|nr:hypothetical protein [Pseudoalteromonas tunicata]ATC96444.1 hypothetical protein PTUN_a4249 [Pseudoalteromonas tunicata]EAR27066.1 hypothetical protein PTD2_05330 [Pseudoalteromonas tunicata D2]MDP4982234.1 hypothetical protein [Pseudoalteromonas tunicata]MDP5212343.1 hypothetical protein [Pseudoalteromonas tunicata]
MNNKNTLLLPALVIAFSMTFSAVSQSAITAKDATATPSNDTIICKLLPQVCKVQD